MNNNDNATEADHDEIINKQIWSGHTGIYTQYRYPAGKNNGSVLPYFPSGVLKVC